MRYSRFALSTLALLASYSLNNNAGFVRAEDVATEAAPEAAATYVPPENAENFKFEAEVSRMLDIVVNSLYQNKDVFLRELISNASDALDKIRFLSISKPELLDEKKELEVRIEYDEEASTLTIRDSGIGMTKADLIKNLGTVARSGTTKFLEALGEGTGEMNMIGQFGVGFYSSFLVADRVSVASKSPSDEVQYIWETINGQSDFNIFPDPRGNSLGRGTEITLHLKEDCKEYADSGRLKDLIEYYSEFVSHPIHLRTTETMTVEVKDDESDETEELKDETEEKSEDDIEEIDAEEVEKEVKTEEVTTHNWEEINVNPAVWTREKEDISDEEYKKFYKALWKESSDDPKTWIHFNAEGNINFKSILYLPDEIPQNLKSGDLSRRPTGGLRLYVRKVLISDEFDLMPPYLSFIKGVVDSDDLPLNVNRETLQESKIIQVIRKKLVRKAIEMMSKLSKEKASKEKSADDLTEVEIDESGEIKEPAKEEDEEKEGPYLDWYKKFAPSIKMGAFEDEANRGKLMKLLRFQSSKTGKDKFVSLEEYVKDMKEWQDEIYVFPGASYDEVDKSQFMEQFKAKDIDVLYLVEPIDEYMIGQLREYDNKKFVTVTKEGIKFKDEDPDLQKRREKAYQKKFKPLTKWLKTMFGPTFMKITLSKRLGSSPAIVSSAEWGNSANMERIMRAQAYQHGADDSSLRAMRVLELNPRHPFVIKLLEGMPPAEDGDDKSTPVVDESLVDTAWMLHDMALLNGGFMIEDYEGYTRRMMRVMQTSLSLDTVTLAEEIDPPVEDDEPPEMDMGDMMGGMGGINMEDFNLDGIDLDAM